MKLYTNEFDTTSAQAGDSFHHPLRIGGIIPKFRVLNIVFELWKLKFLACQVKDAPLTAESGPSRPANVEVSLAWVLLIIRQNSIYKCIRVKGSSSAFSPSPANRLAAQFALDRKRHAASRGRIQFRQNNPSHVLFFKRTCLLQCVLPSGCIQHQPHLMRRACKSLTNHAINLFQFFH